MDRSAHSTNGLASLQEENAALRERLLELEDTLRAVRNGEVDALIDGSSVFTLESAESESNRFRGQVLDQISDVVIAVDNAYHITYLNEAAEKQYGSPAADVLGLKLSALYEYRWVDPGDEAASMVALREHGVWRGENIHIKNNGESVHVESVVKLLKDPGGEIIGYLAVMRDITERVRIREALEEAARQKDRFLATLAHELRNPLSPLMSGLQLMDGADEEMLTTTRAMMQRQLDQLVRLVDDLMDMSRITRGKLELRKERIDLSEVLATAEETSRPLIDRNGHTLDIQIADGSFGMSGDPTRLAQVISNLLNNAAKYTPPGGSISLKLAREGEEGVITVSDNGIGVAPEAIERIFDMFTQVDGSLQGAGGLGIGLNIAQRLTRMHGGTLTATSAGLGKGSTFSVRLPLMNKSDRSPEPVKEDGILGTAASLRILVVDDNHDGATTLVLLLRKAGQQVEIAFNGAEGLARGAAFKPDLVFMDIGMPIMDGYEACRRMRAEAWGQRARIIALSGWGQEVDREASRKAGFDEHLIKPIELHTIRRVIHQLPLEGRQEHAH